ncbi:MAG: serine/threonine protein kinase, partial [bacterium]
MAGSSILHYKILDIIGQGCMGVVYKAKDTRLERLVAIKSLSRHIASDSDVQERFKVEAKAAAVLNHPNIATVYSIEHVNRDYFIIMEFIDGKELREIMRTHKSSPMPIEQAIHYAIQITQGLCAAHENGVVHRDIKPANIMVTSKGQVKITDFGLAKLVGGALLTQVGTTVGTAAYMSPEQSQGEAVDHRTDIWALGAVLYEMVTGQRPFQGDYQQAVVYSILNEDPEPVTQ